jgi:hypothetical protein
VRERETERDRQRERREVEYMMMMMRWCVCMCVCVCVCVVCDGAHVALVAREKGHRLPQARRERRGRVRCGDGFDQLAQVHHPRGSDSQRKINE